MVSKHTLGNASTLSLRYPRDLTANTNPLKPNNHINIAGYHLLKYTENIYKIQTTSVGFQFPKCDVGQKYRKMPCTKGIVALSFARKRLFVR